MVKGMRYLFPMTVLLVVMKLSNILAISWYVALLPSIIWLLIVTLLLFTIGLLDVIVRYMERNG